MGVSSLSKKWAYALPTSLWPLRIGKPWRVCYSLTAPGDRTESPKLDNASQLNAFAHDFRIPLIQDSIFHDLPMNFRAGLNVELSRRVTRLPMMESESESTCALGTRSGVAILCVQGQAMGEETGYRRGEQLQYPQNGTQPDFGLHRTCARLLRRAVACGPRYRTLGTGASAAQGRSAQAIRFPNNRARLQLWACRNWLLSTALQGWARD